MPGFLVEELSTLVEGRGGDELVFSGVRGGGALRATVFRRAAFDEAAASIGLAGLHPHELRHTAASLAIAAGADVKVVQQMLGHASAAMTLDQYGHLFGDRLDHVAEAMEAARAAAVYRMCTAADPSNEDPVSMAQKSPVHQAFREVPPAGFEPAHPPPEGGALSPELRGLVVVGRGGNYQPPLPLPTSVLRRGKGLPPRSASIPVIRSTSADCDSTMLRASVRTAGSRGLGGVDGHAGHRPAGPCGRVVPAVLAVAHPRPAVAAGDPQAPQREPALHASHLVLLRLGEVEGEQPDVRVVAPACATSATSTAAGGARTCPGRSRRPRRTPADGRCRVRSRARRRSRRAARRANRPPTADGVTTASCRSAVRVTGPASPKPGESRSAPASTCRRPVPGRRTPRAGGW